MLVQGNSTLKTFSMKHTFTITAIFTLFVFTLSCSTQQKTPSKGLITIGLAEAYNNRGDVLVSDFASSIEYIPLETGENTFYKFLNIKSTLGDSALLIKSGDRISLFDRKTGSYLRDIGHRGDDPEGFGNTMRDLGINPKKNTVYARGRKFDLYEYDLVTGKMANTIPAPNNSGLSKALSSSSLSDISLIASYGTIEHEYIVGYLLNVRGDEPLRLIIYDLEGNTIKTYPNHQSYEKNPNMIRIETADFHQYNNSLFFKERYNDTTFRVSLDTLEAAVYYALDKYSPPYSEQEKLSQDDLKEYMFVSKTFQNDEFIFFDVWFRDMTQMGYHNKRTNTTHLSKASTSHPASGFINDVDNFVSFYPSFVNEKGELVGLVKAEEVAEWFLDNPDKIASLPGHLQALQSIDPEANPIVMIARPK